MESLQEMIGAARLRGIPEATIQAAIAPLREKANAIVAVVNAASAVKKHSANRPPRSSPRPSISSRI